MTTSEWISLAIVIAAACIAIRAAIDSTRSARQARANLDIARRAARQAWGDAALAELNYPKARNRSHRT